MKSPFHSIMGVLWFLWVMHFNSKHADQKYVAELTASVLIV